MKKTILILIAAIILGTGFYISANGIVPSKKNVTIEKRLSPFDEIDISSIINATYIQSTDNNFKITVSAPDNVVDLVSVSQKNQHVKIEMKRGCNFTKSVNVKVTVHAPILTDIKISGASTFNAASITQPGKKIDLKVRGASTLNINKITGTKIELDINGASTATIKGISSQKFKAEVEGASTAKLSGRAENVELEAKGASTIKASSLAASMGEIESAGTSSIESNIKNVVSRKQSGCSSIKNR